MKAFLCTCVGVLCAAVSSAQTTESQPVVSPLELSAPQPEPTQPAPSIQRPYLASALFTGAWVGGLLATVPFASRADSSYDDYYGEYTAPADPMDIGAGFVLNTGAKLSLNGAMMSFATARYEKTQKARPYYAVAALGATNVAARVLGALIYSAEGSLFGPKDPSDDIYVPAYTLGIVSSSGVTLWALGNALSHSKHTLRGKLQPKKIGGAR
jgi:hypothetical protein